MKTHLILTTVLLVSLVAMLAGGTLMLLRRMHDRGAQDAAAETVMERGQAMVTHLLEQTPDGTSPPDWTDFSTFVRNLHAVEQGLQYVSVTHDGIVVFHEQTSLPGGPDRPATRGVPNGLEIRRELLQTGDQQVPVVVFTATDDTNQNLRVEVALRKEIVSREVQTANKAIASMFRLTLLTICIAFGLCILLVVLMMRREMRHEAFRNEQEHLAFSGMLANGIVHDFRNPMSSLKLDAQMLDREVGKGHESRTERISALAIRMRETLDRMDDVFKAFLFASRPDSAEKVDIAIVACIQESLTVLASRMERNRIKAVLMAPEDVPHVNVFVSSLRRALVNIISNAISFSPGNGATITIRIAPHANHVIIDIADEGPGIPLADRERVFDMFMTTRPEGTGLGLFLARTAIERSGGTIRVVDNAFGSGACIRISLPVA